MNNPTLSYTYPDDALLQRVQSRVGQDDFHLLFNKVYWLRGAQDRIVSRLVLLFAELVRQAELDENDIGNKALDFFNNLTVTSNKTNHDPITISYCTNKRCAVVRSEQSNQLDSRTAGVSGGASLGTLDQGCDENDSRGSCNARSDVAES